MKAQMAATELKPMGYRFCRHRDNRSTVMQFQAKGDRNYSFIIPIHCTTGEMALQINRSRADDQYIPCPRTTITRLNAEDHKGKWGNFSH